MGIDISADSISKNVFDNFKRITPALFAVAVLTGSLLFLPENILEKMALNKLPETARRIVGLTFLLCSAIIVAILFISLIRIVLSSVKQRRLRRNLKKKYKSLSEEHKRIIKTMLNSPNKAIELSKYSGDVFYLLKNCFIHQPAQIASIDYDNDMILTYTPQPWLLDLYNDEPELFK